jgi:AhpD family alkylhydroperoxidase
MAKKQTGYALLGAAFGLAIAAVLTEVYQRAKAICPPFQRRVYSDGRRLLDDLRVLVRHPWMLSAMRSNPMLSRSLVGRIMLAVTGVHGCRHCSYAHTKYALRQGVGGDEAARLLTGEFDDVPMNEVPAILFAQHYAESGGNPDEAAIRRLVEHYGSATARDLLTLVRLVTMTNLIGNTFDALMSRLLGRPSPDSTLHNELTILLLAALASPFLGIAMAREALAG